MLIGLLGATGRTGRAILKLGLPKGHRFRCLVRDPQMLEADFDRVEVLEGDSLDETKVARLSHGCGAVICVIGHGKGSPADLLAHSARNLLITRPRRLVWLASATVDLHGDRKGVRDEIAASGARLFSGRRVRDNQDAADLIQAAASEAVIVRVPAISDAAPRSNWRLTENRPASHQPVSRLDVAAFLLQAAVDPVLPGKAPFISY